MVEWSTAPCSNVNPLLVVLNSAPPQRLLRSTTSTSTPARARYAAQTSPLWPPPSTTTSARSEASPTGEPRTSRKITESYQRARLGHAGRRRWSHAKERL